MKKSSITSHGITVNVKLLTPDAKMPVRGTDDSAGWDLSVTKGEYDPTNNTYLYYTGVALEIPKGYVGLLFPRSSSYKLRHLQTNCVGVIDSDYRGEVMVRFYHMGNYSVTHYNAGERCCQLVIMPFPEVTFNLAEELSATMRGTGGFGSTGK